MSEQVTKYGDLTPAAIHPDQFQFLLNKEPSREHLRKTPDNRADTIPIGFVENLLDEYYSGLWKTTNFRFSLVANELVGIITLHVFHPVFKVWLTREGTGAKAIQVNSLTQDEKDAMTKQQRNLYAQNIENKIPNCIEKQIGAVKAEALKNAAKSLGVVFGRNLNRKDLDDYEYNGIGEIADADSLAVECRKMLDESTLPETEKTAIVRKIERGNVKTLNRIKTYLESKK